MIRTHVGKVAVNVMYLNSDIVTPEIVSHAGEIAAPLAMHMALLSYCDTVETYYKIFLCPTLYHYIINLLKPSSNFMYCQV
jgi:hypothetical protein